MNKQLAALQKTFQKDSKALGIQYKKGDRAEFRKAKADLKDAHNQSVLDFLKSLSQTTA